MSTTSELCEKIAAIGFADLPEAAVAAARQLVLDGIAIAAAGSLQRGPQILAAHVQELGGRADCNAIGFGFRTNPVQAAYLNGATMHVLDYEPMWSPANHQVSTALPAVLALAEARGAPGGEALTALVKGIEIMGWMREASGQIEPRYHRFHPPGLVGAFGGAAAAGHLLDLDAVQMRHAFGLAASRSGSLLANVGTMTKATHCGLACALGLDAAMLAARGFTANTEVFEAALGYVEAFHDDKFDLAALLNFGRPFRIVEPGYAIKLFPSQYGTHFGIAAAIELHRKIPEPDAIESVTLTTPVMPYTDRPRPKTGLDGKFSLQYTAACGLLDGKVTIDSFTDERRFRPDMDRLLDRIHLVQTDAIPGYFEAMHVEIAVRLTDSQQLAARCEKPRGAWGTPPLRPEEHLAKVQDCLERRFDAARIARCLDLVGRFERLEGDDIRALLDLLSCRGDQEKIAAHD